MSRSLTESQAIPQIAAKPIPWLQELTAEAGRLRALLDRFGSPLHLHRPEPFRDNVSELQAVGQSLGLPVEVFFARKANKALCYVEAARNEGIGIDVASYEELEQTLALGVDADRIIVSSAIKTDKLLEVCLARGVLVVVDNHDEAARLMQLAGPTGTKPAVAIRLSNFAFERGPQPPSRFGFDVQEPELLDRLQSYSEALRVQGLHFHLDGYDYRDRVDALDQTLRIHDRLVERGVSTDFIDIGGGFPMSYAADESQWLSFWAELDRALLANRSAVTYRNGGYGQFVHAGEVVGPRYAYPHHQSPTGAVWLRTMLDSVTPGVDGRSIAERFADRGLQLRCEPGRALLDGCGATISTVVHRKPLGDDLLVALDMNSSNCRTQKSELLTDPIYVLDGLDVAPAAGTASTAARTGYLTGAYCSESDLLTSRRLRFEKAPQAGDLVIFPNTAGYLMHFTESRSHQFPLPRNVYRNLTDGEWRLDRIDAAPDHPPQPNPV